MSLYRVPPEETWQLQNHDPNGGKNCSAWSANAMANRITEGRKNPGGARIRALSSEPIPNPKSPGLTLPQVCDVLEDDYGIHMDVYVGWRALTFDQYEAKRRNGKPALCQLGYSPIAASDFDAGRGFRGNHMVFEDNSATYDPLADGRAKGVYENKRGDVLYPRDVIKHAAGQLVLRYEPSGQPVERVGYGRVWCAFGSDVLPAYNAVVKPKPGRKTITVNTYTVKDGHITGFVPAVTKGFDVPCNPPRVLSWPGHGQRYVVFVQSGPLKGRWLNAHWAEEA